ncbi:NDMA-dependent alcohol dehydrogenase [Amycolatopsis pithecellobii]|uniref:NDMA-dependent alcohol dehydrogenase n=1 Tax=Amycolatopsis pithecellobii TaxID=664692 RepID=A0A6N7ZCC5_9PSEU|nr:NDMA-dependent alcohol dehydrogenase [Amycolatopsis pithecellobii]MTD59378.1 NDMA-dependent alcohol dehydrogenase [Amycolatopsis pithecellobii]
MHTRAAIIRESPGTFEVVDVELDDPRQGELKVRMVASGLCHSDDHFQTGDMPPGHLPLIGGHEGAGVVEEVGPNTPGWDVGDHVVFSFMPSCGRCRFCSEGMTNLCDLGAYLLIGSRFDAEGSFRFSLPDGTGVGQNCAVGTFAERTVVSVDSAIKVDKDLPLDKLCLLGCAVGTGMGSAINSAGVRPGDITIVMGVGGIGINAVQGAAHAGATATIAVDPVALKRDTALAMGATHAFTTIAEAAEHARSMTNGQGADSAIVTPGVVSGQDVADAFAAIRKGGVVVVTGTTPMDEIGIPVSLFELTLMQKRIQGSLFGGCNPRADIPRQIDMYRNGQLKLDDLVTKTYRLDDITKAYDDLRAGLNIRGVVLFD